MDGEELKTLKDRLKEETSFAKMAELLIEIGKKIMKKEPAEAKRISQEAVALAKRSKEKKVYAEALNFHSFILYTSGLIDSALSYAQKALKISDIIGDKSVKAVSSRIIGLIHQEKGNLDLALAFFEQSLITSKEIADEGGIAASYNNLSLVYWYKGELKKALEYQKMSLETKEGFKEEFGRASGIATSRLNMGVIYEDMGEWELATECFYRAMVEKEKMKDLSGIALCYNNMGEIYLKKGRYEKALSLFNSALSYVEKSGSEQIRCEVLGNLGNCYFLLGDKMRAMNFYVEAMTGCSRMGLKEELAKTYRRMGELLIASSELKEAEDFLFKALSLVVEIGAKREEGNVRREIGKYLWLVNKKKEAKESFQKSIEILSQLGILYELGKTYFDFGKFLIESYSKESGLPYLKEAENIFKRLEVFAEKEELEKYLYHLEEDKDKEIALLKSLSSLAANPMPLPEFCSRFLNLLKDILPIRGASITVGAQRFVIGEIGEEGEVSMPLFFNGKELGTILIFFKKHLPPFSEIYKEAISNILSLGIEKARSLVILKPEEPEVYEKFPFDGVIGRNQKVRELFTMVKKAASTKATILILGESGTGKELIGRFIHNLSPRANKPFITINCAAIPETLLESELFGVEKGVATGVSERKGKFELANEGTIFLDEIGDMSSALQAKVLRVLQERNFERVGGKETIEVDVRIIAATNRDLEKSIKEGKFREDLYFRLNVISLHIPPLRERKEDIPLFVEYFIKKYNKEFARAIKEVDSSVMARFFAYDWPGNIRELENVIERAIILAREDTISVSELPQALRELSTAEVDSTLKIVKKEVQKEVAQTEKELIKKILEENDWNITKSSKKLKISTRHLYRLIKKYDLKRI